MNTIYYFEDADGTVVGPYDTIDQLEDIIDIIIEEARLAGIEDLEDYIDYLNDQLDNPITDNIED